LVVALFVALMFFGLRRGALTARGSAFGALVLLACAACSAGAVKLIWWALTTMHGGFTPRTHADIFVVGFTLLTLGITVALYASLGRRTTLNNLAAGALACWTIVMLAASLLLPGASYLFTWPLLSSLLALGFVLYTAEKTGTRPARFLVLAACAVPGLLLLTNVIAGLYQGVGLSMPVALVALEVLLLGLLVPFLRYITSRFRWLFVTASLLVGAACVFLGIVTPLYDERNPRPNSLLYSLNADTGQTTWMSTDARPDAWTSQFFKASHNDPNQPPAASGRALTAPAPAVELPLEELSVLGDEVVSGVRRLRVRVTSPRRARRINMYVDPSVKITAAVVNGKRLEYAGASEADRADEGWELAYVAAPAEGFELTLETPSAAPLKLKVAGYADGLPHVPSMQITPRPPNLMPGPNSDQTRVVKTFDLGPAPR